MSYYVYVYVKKLQLKLANASMPKSALVENTQN